MKRPLVTVVSIYSAGLLLAEFVQPPLVALFAIAFAVLLAALILERFRPWLCWPLLVLAGWTNLASRTAVVSPHDLRTLVGTNDALVTVRGILATTPHLRLSERDDQPVERSLAQVRVAALRQDSGWQPAVGDLVVTTPGTLPTNFFAGQPVEISGVIGRPPPPLAEGLFDYREYLQMRGIFYLLKTGSVNDWQPDVPALSRPPLTDRFLSWSQRTLALGLPVEDQPLRLLWAMTLGWRTALTPDISEPFLRAGTIIHFAFHEMDKRQHRQTVLVVPILNRLPSFLNGHADIFGLGTAAAYQITKADSPTVSECLTATLPCGGGFHTLDFFWFQL